MKGLVLGHKYNFELTLSNGSVSYQEGVLSGRDGNVIVLVRENKSLVRINMDAFVIVSYVDQGLKKS